MTGEKDKGTTLEKMSGLEDKELATPRHDEMVLKLLDKKYFIKRFIQQPEKYHMDSLVIKSEVPMHNYKGFLIGYWDIVATVYKKTNPITEVKLFIEVKPKIRSFGETLRQLNTYIVYIDTKVKKNSHYFIFTPDLRFKEAFEGQGIYLIPPLKDEP